MSYLSSFNPNLRIALIGATGGIGYAMTELLIAENKVEKLYTLGRTDPYLDSRKYEHIELNLADEGSIETASKHIKAAGPLDMALVMTGLLHDDKIAPEKSARQITPEAFESSFAVNCFGPALVGKHFLPLLRRDQKTVFAALSARVGSISDNRLGGWYAYRSSKAALNMILKTFSVEYGRRSKQMIILGLHPGTVDTKLSEPFQANVPDGKLFTPEYSATRLLSVIDSSTPADTGHLLAWDGETIPF